MGWRGSGRPLIVRARGFRNPLTTSRGLPVGCRVPRRLTDKLVILSTSAKAAEVLKVGILPRAGSIAVVLIWFVIFFVALIKIDVHQAGPRFSLLAGRGLAIGVARERRVKGQDTFSFIRPEAP